MTIDVHQLQYHLFPGENPRPEWLASYLDTYRLWKSVWSATFHELDGNGTVFSDDFSRQSLIGSLMLDQRCVGACMFHFVDFRLPTARDDSWFKAWTDSAFEKLLRDGPSVMVGSYVTVDPEFRGDLGNGLRLRNAILGLISKTLLASDADVLAGSARRNRGVDKASALAGATHLEYGKLHGVDVDLVAFYRRQIAAEHSFDFAVESLWRKRLVHGPAQPLLLRTAA